MKEETTVLYRVLKTLTKDGLVKVVRQDCCEVDFKKGLYWPDEPGAGDCHIGDMRSTVPEALNQETKSLNKELRELKRAIEQLETRLAAVQAGIADPSKVYLSNRSPC